MAPCPAHRFQHDGLGRQLRRHLAQAVGLRPGRRAAEAEAEAELEVLAGFLAAAGEGMDDATALQADALEGGDGRRVGAAHVDQRRQAEFRGQPQLGLEQRLLGVAVEVFQVVVQADLADRAELRLAAQALQPLAQVVQVLRAVPRQVDGVQAERRVQAILGLRQVPDPLPVLAVDAEHHLALDPQRAAALQQRGAVGVEVREVEVVVGVDQAHGGRLSRAA